MTKLSPPTINTERLQALMRRNHARWSPHSLGPSPLRDLEWTTLALCGEAGELANEVKKIARDDAGTFTGERLGACRAELADVLAYTVVLAGLLGLEFHELMADVEENAEQFDQRMTERATAVESATP